MKKLFLALLIAVASFGSKLYGDCPGGNYKACRKLCHSGSDYLEPCIGNCNVKCL